MPTVMVQMADERWTIAAMHIACKRAQELGAEVALVDMISADFMDWVAADSSQYHFSESEDEEIKHFGHIADQYGVKLSIHVFRYVQSLADAITAAADRLNAEVVYATLPETVIPLLHRWQVSHLKHQMHDHHHEIHVLEVPVDPAGTPVEE